MLFALFTAPSVTGCADTAAQSNLHLHRIDTDLARHKDLGKLRVGDEIKHFFTIRNTTSKPLKLVSIQKTCGCETASLVEGAIVPVGKELGFQYSLPAYGAGERVGRLVICTDSDDEAFKQIELTLRAELPRTVWSSPPQLLFDSISEDASPQKEFRVESVVPGLLERFREVATSRGLVSIELTHRTSEVLVFAATLRDDAPFGELHDYVNLAFDDRTYPQLNIQVRGHKQGPFTALPRLLILTPFLGDEPQTRRVRIQSGTQRHFRIRQITCPTNIVVDRFSDDAHESFDLTIHFSRPPHTLGSDVITCHTEPPGDVSLSVRYISAKVP